MADISVKVTGGKLELLEDMETIQDVKDAMDLPNHAATKNGQPAGNEDALADGDFIILTTAVKGGSR